MTSNTSRALAGLVLGIAANSASAGLLFENPFFAGASGNDATLWVQSSSFTLGSDATITGSTVAIAGLGNITNWDGAFDYWFFADDTGAPGSIVGAGAANINSVADTGTAWGSGGNIWNVDFDLASPFSASAGTQYWLGVHLASDFDNRDDIYWVQSTSTQATSESPGGTFDNWFTYSPARAFTLVGDESVPPSPVSAPGTIALIGLGLAGVGLRRLKRA